MNCSKCKKDIPDDSNFCPFCGTSLVDINGRCQNDFVFPLYDIVLGNTTIAEVANTHHLWDKVAEEGDTYMLLLLPGLCAVSYRSPHNPIIMVYADWDIYNDTKKLWQKIIPLSPDNTENEITSWCKINNLSCIKTTNRMLIMKGQAIISIGIDKTVCGVMSPVPPCPKCGNMNLLLERYNDDENILLSCKSCKHKFNLIKELKALYF